MMFWTCVRSVFARDEQRLADLGRRQALGQGLEDLSSRAVSGSMGGRSGYRSRRARRRAGRCPMITERGRRVSPAQALRTVGDDVVDRAVLGQVAIGAGLDRFEHGLVVLHRGEHHDPGARPARLDRPRRLGAGAVGQAVVHEDDVHPLAQRAAWPRRRVPAMPTTSMSGSAASSRASESVSSWWSSTRSTRIGLASPVMQPPRGVERREAQRTGARALWARDGSTAAERVGGPAAILAGMRVALLGLGLIGGSSPARCATRPAMARRSRGRSPPGRRPGGPGRGAGGRRHRRGRRAPGGGHRRRRAGRPGRPARRTAWPCSTSSPGRGARPSPRTRSSPTWPARRGARPARDGARAAVRRRPPDGRPRDEPATRPRARTCSSIGRGSWCRRGGRRGAVERVERLAVACGARPVRLGPRPTTGPWPAISHLPLVVAAALVEAVAGTASAGPTGRTGRPPRAWRRRLARHDPPGPRRRDDGRRHRRHERPGDRRPGPRPRGGPRRWLAELERPGGPDAGDDRGPAASRARTRWRRWPR